MTTKTPEKELDIDLTKVENILLKTTKIVSAIMTISTIASYYFFGSYGLVTGIAVYAILLFIIMSIWAGALMKKIDTYSKIDRTRYDQLDTVTGILFKVEEMIAEDRAYLTRADYQSLLKLRSDMMVYITIFGRGKEYCVKAAVLAERVTIFENLEEAVTARKPAPEDDTQRTKKQVEKLLENVQRAVPDFLNRPEPVQRRLLKPYAEELLEDKTSKEELANLIEAALGQMKSKSAA